MDELLKRYCPRIEFDSYEDFYENYKVNVPQDFNFAYDIVDEWAKIDENKPQNDNYKPVYNVFRLIVEELNLE